MQETINAANITCINRKVWTALVKAARNTPAGERTFNYFSNVIGTSFKTYLSGKYSERSDMRLVAKLVGVTPCAAARWLKLCDTRKPVFHACTLSTVRAVLSNHFQTAPVSPVSPVSPVQPETTYVIDPIHPAANVVKLKAVPHAFSSELDNDMQRLRELKVETEKLTAKIETRKHEVRERIESELQDAIQAIKERAAAALRELN
jgi:hypothetical protein